MRIIFLIFAILFSSCNVEKKPQIIIPDEKIDTVFTKYVDNPITEKYQLAKLRETALSSNDLEIRVWASLGYHGIDGFILKRINGNWSGIAIKELDCNSISYYKGRFYQTGKIDLAPPKSGWDNAWQKLVRAGVLDLPDYDEVSLIDGFGYFTEINVNNTYRTYHYSNPDVYKIKETDAQKRINVQKMLEIGEIIADEFSLGNLKAGNMCLEK